MRLLTAVYAILALAFCLWLGLHWKNAVEAEPRSLLDRARAAISATPPELSRALADLALALEGAEAARDQPLIEEVLLARAALLRKTGGFAQARSDLERVLTHFRPGAPAVEAQLARVDLDSGEVESALARSSSVLAKDRNQPEAWSVRAGALLRLAERKLASARERAGSAVNVPGVDAPDRLMRRIAVLDPSDPDRERLVNQLYESFSASERDRAREVVEDLDDASRLFSQAPEALAESLRGPVERSALSAYLRLLADAGETDAAIDLGLSLARMPWLETYPPFLRDLIDMLVENGRERAAPEVVPGDLGRKVPLDASFFGSWSVALLRTQRWQELRSVGNFLRHNGEPDQRVTASFYLGMAEKGLGLAEEARLSLQRFVAQQAIEPHPGALVEAWLALADLHRAAKRPEEELAALRHCAALANDRTPGAGEVWLRIAELDWVLPSGNRFNAVDEYAHALRLTPARAAELEALWRSRGQSAVDAMHIDLEAIVRELSAKGLTYPDGRRSSYEYVRVAEICLARDETSAALVTARRTYDSFPGLLPALDALADAYAAAGDSASSAEMLRQRVELAGPDPRTMERLLALGAPTFGAQWRADLVRFDPEGVGRRWAAELLADRGDTADAIDALLRVSEASMSDDGHLLLAEMLFEQGHEDRAQREVAKLSADVHVLARALPISIAIGVRQHDPAHLSKLIALLRSDVAVDTLALLDCADQMLRAEMLESARELLATLDDRPRTRSPALYVRMAGVELIAGDRTAAAEALERAHAYDESGATELGRVVIEVEERRWNTLPERVRELLDTAWDPTPIQYVVATALAERLDEARAAAAVARAEEPDDPLWPLIDAALDALGARTRATRDEASAFERTHGFGVSATGGVERDPRPLLARILALGHRDWTAWAIADLSRRAPPAPGSLWPTYLAALGQLWSGDSRGAENAGRKLIGAWPEFEPAWDVVEGAIEDDVRRPDHPRLLRLAEQRRARFGGSQAPTTDVWLAEARIAEQRGDLAAALEAARKALALDPERNAARRKLAQLHRRREEWVAALAAFHDALAAVEPDSDSHPVREFVELCDEARVRGGATLEIAVRGELDFLASRFTSDPLVTLAVARQAVRDSTGDRRSALVRVRTLLEDLRGRTRGVALDELRPGSAAEWIRFLGDIDAQGAWELAEAELLLVPASVELWRAVGETAERLHLADRALEATEIALRMLPDASSALRAVQLSARRGDSVAEVRRRVAQAREIAGRDANERAFDVCVARALLHGTRAELGEAIGLLQQLWETRDGAARPAELLEVGRLYGFALCRRAGPQDRTPAMNVFEELRPRVTDPTERTLISAMVVLSRFVGV
jgi:tetratricopeptide (TPR) repeat protein